jgi:hypothetical protein
MSDLKSLPVSDQQVVTASLRFSFNNMFVREDLPDNDLVLTIPPVEVIARIRSLSEKTGLCRGDIKCYFLNALCDINDFEVDDPNDINEMCVVAIERVEYFLLREMNEIIESIEKDNGMVV